MLTHIEYDKDNDEYNLILPDELLQELGWNVGDTLIWTIENGEVYLDKE